MEAIWKAAISFAGLGAIASFVVWSVYKRWLSLPIFQQLTKEQLYKLFILLFWLTFFFGVIGIAAYVVIELNRPLPPSIQKGEASHAELLALMRQRKQEVLKLIDERTGDLREHLQKVTQEGQDTTKIDEALKLLQSIKTQFSSLSTDYLKALDKRQHFHAHELVRSIHTLLDDPKTQALFPVRVFYGDDRGPAYVPSRQLAEKFFKSLPPEYDEQVEAAFPCDNPFKE